MKTVLITGASRGIGKKTALDFLKAGYNVAANYCNTHLDEEDYEDYKNNILCLKADISKYDQVEKMVSAVLSHFGSIDIVINNGAVSHYGLLIQMTESEWDDIMGVNLKSLFNVCKSVLPHMIDKKAGKIINISSMWGITGASCEVAYSTTKAGVIGFTKALAKEVAPSNILVNCVAPGIIETDMICDFDKKDLSSQVPLERLGSTEDVSNMILFLASDKASYITGQVFSVNGGYLI